MYPIRTWEGGIRRPTIALSSCTLMNLHRFGSSCPVHSSGWHSRMWSTHLHPCTVLPLASSYVALHAPAPAGHVSLHPLKRSVQSTGHPHPGSHHVPLRRHAQNSSECGSSRPVKDVQGRPGW